MAKNIKKDGPKPIKATAVPKPKKTVLDSNLVVPRGAKSDTMSVAAYGRATEQLSGGKTSANKAAANALAKAGRDKKGNFVLSASKTTPADRDAANFARTRKAMNSKYSSVDKKKGSK